MSNQDYDQNQSPDQTAQGQDQFGQQQQYDPSSGQMDQGQMGQMGQSGQSGQDQFGGARQAAQGQVDNAIDQFANRIPGGGQYAQQAKDAANQGIDNMEQEAENRMGNAGGGIGERLGGMFGGNSDNQGGQP